MPEDEPIQNPPEPVSAPAESAQPPANDAHPEEEHTPMLDVHMPHATHTWRDFFIHIATISVGLLIAIGLEQTVEYLHHLHQRHQLEEQFTAEGEGNKLISEDNFRALDDHMEWLLGLQQDIQIMRSTGGKANLPYREVRYRPHSQGYGPGLINLGTAVWDDSKGTERFALLPDELADMYTRTYRQAESYRDLTGEMRSVAANQAAFEMKFADSGSPLTPVLSRMSPTELAEYEGLVTAHFTATRQSKGNLWGFYGDNISILKGLRGPLAASAEQEAARKQFPDDFKKMAAEIEAERAKGVK